jgi:hypothetical protein
VQQGFCYCYSLTFRETLRATRNIVDRWRYLRWSKAITLPGILAFLALLSIRQLAFAPPKPWEWIGLAILCMVYLLWYFALPALAAALSRWNNRAADEQCLLILREDGLHITSTGLNASIDWSNICKVYESQEFIFFYASAVQAIVLPKRVIPFE